MKHTKMRYGKPDAENPEWTAADFRAARPAGEVFPDAFSGKPPKRLRGPQRAPTKERVTLRLSRSVLSAYRQGGRGWQTRLDADLQRLTKRRRAG